MIELVDSHTHLDAEDFAADREAVIERARAAGVTRIVTIGAGSGFLSAQNAIALAEKYDFIWASAGIHPHDSKEPIDAAKLRSLASHPRVVAIGETGLDYYRDWAPKDLQQQWFEIQIDLARELQKPLIIHSREAGEDCIKTLLVKGAKDVGGVFHCFAENAEFAARLRDINFLISVPGTISFKKADAFRETIKNVPLSQIMLETDAPYLAPEPHRGKRCETSFMVETAKVVAKVKNLSFEEVAEATTRNAIAFYKLS